MSKAYAYIRWSTEKQSDGDSHARQISGVELFKERFPEVEVEREYIDEGVSSYSGKNRISGELARMLEDVKRGQIRAGDYIVCESIDRLTREGWEVATDLIRGLLKKEINLYTTFDSRLYTHTRLEDFLMISLIAERARNESLTKSIRIKEAWKRRTAVIGRPIFKTIAPFGLRIENGKYEIDKEAQAEIKELLEVITTSGASKAISIVNQYSTYRWSKAKLYAMFSKKWIIGVYSKSTDNFREKVENGEVIGRRRRQVIVEQIENYYPHIVSEALFYRAVKAMEGRDFGKERGRRSTNFGNIFNKVIFCHCCWQPLYFQSVKNPNGSKSKYIRIYHCVICKWQMPFDVAFYEFLYFLYLQGIQNPGDGIGGKVNKILYEQKRADSGDVEKAESEYYKAVEDERAFSQQLEAIDVFPLPQTLINKAKQVAERVKTARQNFEGMKAKADETEVEVKDFANKMKTEKGRLELNSILRKLNIQILFWFKKQDGMGWIEVHKVAEGNPDDTSQRKRIWRREFCYPKTNRGTRAKDMVEEFGFNVVELMEGQ